MSEQELNQISIKEAIAKSLAEAGNKVLQTDGAIPIAKEQTEGVAYGWGLTQDGSNNLIWRGSSSSNYNNCNDNLYSHSVNKIISISEVGHCHIFYGPIVYAIYYKA